MTHRARILVEGRVQGIGFRYRACDEARRLGLCGWVRNLADGRVELEAEGPEDVLKQLIGWCHHGPRFARVDRVEIDVGELDTARYAGFSIR